MDGPDIIILSVVIGITLCSLAKTFVIYKRGWPKDEQD